MPRSSPPGRPRSDKELDLTVATPSYIRIMVDPQRFAQVVDNLVSNAVKYTPTGGSVTVDLTAYDDHIELSVADTGIGIDPAERDRLFTRFFRTRDAEERSIQGVGLACRSPRRSSRPTAAGSRWTAARPAPRSGCWLPLDLVLAEGHEQAREDLEMLAEIERLKIS